MIAYIWICIYLVRVIYFYRFFFIKLRHVGAVRDEELLDFASRAARERVFSKVRGEGVTLSVLGGADLDFVEFVSWLWRQRRMLWEGRSGLFHPLLLLFVMQSLQGSSAVAHFESGSVFHWYCCRRRNSFNASTTDFTLNSDQFWSSFWNIFKGNKLWRRK